MSKTTPDDLVVAYRSLPRRRAEAVDAADAAPVGGLLTEFDQHITAAAALLGTAADPQAIAAAISSRPARDWDGATIDRLRHHATEAGAVLRRIADLAPPVDERDAPRSTSISTAPAGDQVPAHSSGLVSTSCSTTRPSTASTNTSPRWRGGSSTE